nr:retrovirus-related Pol polyprotein from transposon TNT 1-94 [Tanacetum cinerariifolium]
FATRELNRLNKEEGKSNRGGIGSRYGRLTKFEFPKFYGEDEVKVMAVLSSYCQEGALIPLAMVSNIDVIMVSGGRPENQPTTTMVVVKDLERESRGGGERLRERERERERESRGRKRWAHTTGFTSIRHIHQEDTAYPCPNFRKTSMSRRLNTLYPKAFIRRIERRLMNILEYYNRRAYAKYSTHIAQYVAIAGCCTNILWMKSQLTDYDIIYEKVLIFCDNTSAITISNNPVLHSRTKHIDIRYHSIRDHVLKGDIELHFIRTQYQLADIFNNPLEESTFKRLIVELGGVRGEIGITTFRNALKAVYLPHSTMYVPPPSITTIRPWFATIGYTREIGTKETLKKSCLPLRWRLLMAQIMEKIVPYPRFISLLLEHMALEYENEELTINPTQVFSVHNLTLKPNQPEEPPFTDHMKAIYNLVVHVESKAPKPSSQTEKQAAGGPTSLGATSEEEAHPNLNSGLKTTHTTSSANEESGADDMSRKVKLEDLADILKDTRSSRKKELEQAKAIAEAEVVSMKAKPSYPDINQLTKLLVTSLKPGLSKLLASHDFARCWPIELKELPSKIIGLSREIKELKQHIKDMEIELLRDLKEIPSKLETFTSTISNLSSQVAELKNIQWELPANTLNMFATLVENASGATTTGVPSADKATASPAEGEKDAEINLKNELVDLLGIDIVIRYYNKKVLYERYCEKMKKKRQSSKIINCDVLIKKGPISLKIYREDRTAEVIEKFKASDLQLAEWREEMEDRDMTMKEHVQYETEKALRNGKVYNWKTATYVSPQHIDEINLKKETSLSEYDGGEYNVTSFNDLFPFNVFFVNDPKLDTYNDDD